MLNDYGLLAERVETMLVRGSDFNYVLCEIQFQSFCSQFRLNGGYLEHVGNESSWLRTVSPVRLPSDIGITDQGNSFPVAIVRDSSVYLLIE